VPYDKLTREERRALYEKYYTTPVYKRKQKIYKCITRYGPTIDNHISKLEERLAVARAAKEKLDEAKQDAWRQPLWLRKVLLETGPQKTDGGGSLQNEQGRKAKALSLW